MIVTIETEAVVETKMPYPTVLLLVLVIDELLNSRRPDGEVGIPASLVLRETGIKRKPLEGAKAELEQRGVLRASRRPGRLAHSINWEAIPGVLLVPDPDGLLGSVADPAHRQKWGLP